MALIYEYLIIFLGADKKLEIFFMHIAKKKQIFVFTKLITLYNLLEL